jgi:hypothetical protein
MSIKNTHKAMQAGYGMCPIDSAYSGPLERHHIRGRKVKDYNKPWNVVYLSPNSHTLVHEGKIIIERWIMTTEGKELIWRNAGDDMVSCMNEAVHIVKRSNS